MRSLAQWLALQESAHPLSIDMGLERVTTVARALQVDQAHCPVITVGGTNGKGSTCAHLEAMLAAAGLSTGLFISPHFVRYNERIRVDGTEVDDRELIAAFEHIEQARGDITLTFFEYNTLAALLIFRSRAVQVAVLEVGLGGRLDATNLIAADVAVVCSVGLDHREWLGNTLEEIGAEKAGIFRSGRPAVLGTPQMPDSVWRAVKRIQARAVVAERDYHWRVAGRDGRWDYQGLQLCLEGLPPSALPGAIQYRNAATALAALESLPVALSAAHVVQALERVQLAGRFQVVPGAVEWILDIAHNEPAAQVFAEHLREYRERGGARGRVLGVTGILTDKDAPAIVAALRPLVSHWILCGLPGPRGSSADALAARVRLPAAEVTLAASVAQGCELARAQVQPGDCVIVFGSVYAVGPALQWLGIY